MTALSLAQSLRELRWPVTAERHQQVALQAEREGLSFTQYLHALVERFASVGQPKQHSPWPSQPGALRASGWCE